MSKKLIKNFVFDLNKEISITPFIKKLNEIYQKNPNIVLKIEANDNDVLFKILNAPPSKQKQNLVDNSKIELFPKEFNSQSTQNLVDNSITTVVKKPINQYFYEDGSITENFKTIHDRIKTKSINAPDVTPLIILTLLETDFYHEKACYYSKQKLFDKSNLLFQKRDEKILQLIDIADDLGVKYGKEKAFTPGPAWCVYFAFPTFPQIYWRTDIPNKKSMPYYSKKPDNYKISIYTRIFNVIQDIFPEILEK